MSSLRIEIPNLQNILNGLLNIPDETESRFARAITEETELIATEAKEITPVDTGALRASVHAEPVKRRFGTVEGSVAAGGPAAPYAVVVHERMDRGINWSVKGTGPRYIEKPMLAAIPRIGKRLGVEIEKAIKDSMR